MTPAIWVFIVAMGLGQIFQIWFIFNLLRVKRNK